MAVGQSVWFTHLNGNVTSDVSPKSNIKPEFRGPSVLLGTIEEMSTELTLRSRIERGGYGGEHAGLDTRFCSLWDKPHTFSEEHSVSPRQVQPSRMPLQVNGAVPKSDSLTWIPRTDVEREVKLSPDLHKNAMACMCVHTCLYK